MAAQPPGEGSESRLCDAEDEFERSVFVLGKVAGGDADDFESQRAKERVTSGVLLAGSAVLVAVEFDDESRVGAVEVDDEAVNRLLAAKLEAAEIAVAQARPENDFWWG